MIYVILLALVHIVSAYFIATRFLRPSRLSDLPLEWAMVTLTSFYGVPLLLGVSTGLMNTYTLLLSACLAAGVAVYGRLKYSRGAVGLAELLRGFRRFSPYGIALWLVVALFVVGAYYVASVLPVRAWDAVGYHISGAMGWVQSGRFIIDSFGDPKLGHPYYMASETYPNSKAILPFAIMLWSGSTAGTALAQWPFLILLITGLYALYRRLNLTHFFSVLGIVFCIYIPEVLLQSVEMYGDIAFFGGVVSVIWALLAVWQSGFTLARAANVTLAFGLLVSTKPTAVPVCVVLGGIYLLVVFFRSLRGMAWGRRFGRVALAFGAVIAISLLMAGPWYINGIVKVRNPVYPMNVSVAGKTVFYGPYDPKMNSTQVEQFTGRKGADALWGTLVERWRSPSIASWSGGLGAATCIIGLPCLVAYLIILVGVRGRRAPGELLVVAAFVLLILTCPSPTLGRFLMFAMALVGLAVGVVGSFVHWAPRHIVVVTVLGLCGYNVYKSLPSLLYRQRNPELVRFNLDSGYTRAARDDNYPDQYTAQDHWLDKVGNPQARIAFTEETMAWKVFEPVIRPGLTRVGNEGKEDFAEFMRQVEASGASHLLLSRTSKHYPGAIGSPRLKVIYASYHAHPNKDSFMPAPPNTVLFEVTK